VSGQAITLSLYRKPLPLRETADRAPYVPARGLAEVHKASRDQEAALLIPERGVVKKCGSRRAASSSGLPCSPPTSARDARESVLWCALPRAPGHDRGLRGEEKAKKTRAFLALLTRKGAPGKIAVDDGIVAEASLPETSGASFFISNWAPRAPSQRRSGSRQAQLLQ